MNNTKTKALNLISVSLALALSLTPMPVLAETSEAILNAEASTFSVTVPTILPIDVDNQQNVTVATDVVLTNNSIGPIKVDNIEIVEKNSWVKVTTPSDKVGTKEFNMQVSTESEIIASKSNTLIVYSAQVSPQKQSTHEIIADVIFTIGWDNAVYPSTSLVVDQPEVDFIPGTAKGITFKFENVTSETVTWASSNEAVATVEADTSRSALISGQNRAIIKAVGTGATTITATLPTGTSESLVVEIKEPIIADMEHYKEGNYDYTYLKSMNGWRAAILDKTKTVYDPPLEMIKGKPVVDYYLMFEKYPYSTLTLAGEWGNANVRSMTGMFRGCKAKSIDFSSFKTASVENFELFLYESSSTSLDVSSFDTSSATNMSHMFTRAQCTEIIGLDQFDTSNVTNMYIMFNDCKALELDLCSFDTSKADTGHMFDGASATTGYARTQDEANKFNATSGKPATLVFKLHNSEPEQPEKDVYTYTYDDATQGYKVSLADNTQTSYKQPLEMVDGIPVTSYDRLFMSYPNSELILEGTWSNSNVKSVRGMFNFSNAVELDLSNFNTNNVTDMAGMFANSKVNILNISNFNTSKVVDMMSMFSSSKVTKIDVSNFDTRSVTDMRMMFLRSQINTLDLRSFDTNNVMDMADMFGGSAATVGHARTQADADKFNSSTSKPDTLIFTVKA